VPGGNKEQAIKHFKAVVEPAALEFLDPPNLGSVRHGYQAAIMLAHMAEHFFKAGLATSTAKTSSEFYQELTRQNEAFCLIADVCDAGKHVVLNVQIRTRERAILGSASLRAGPQKANSSRRLNSRIRINQNVVFVRFDRGPQAGQQRELDRPVREVLAFWRRELGLMV
jgi:hypothetical protein